ncbi:MAG: TIGR04211 family SH3 domain-containing protein [Myxococcota bacterium]
MKLRLARSTGSWLSGSSATLLVTALLASIVLGATGALAAEQGWVKGDLRLNVRTGGGNEYRIIGTVATGDSVKVLSRGTDWIQVQTADGKVGWIPAGYVEATPPAAARLATAEADVASLKSELEKLRSETTQLRESNGALTANDDGQKKELEALTLENLQLRAVSRYQEWLTGAALLGGGMLLGAWLHSRSGTRRGSSRIRL